MHALGGNAAARVLPGGVGVAVVTIQLDATVPHTMILVVAGFTSQADVFSWQQPHGGGGDEWL